MIALDSVSINRPLSGGMILRTAASPADCERVAEINSLIHGPAVGELTRALTAHFPGLEPRDVIFVADEQTGAVVSTLMLIPWTFYYGDIAIPAGELAIVGTLEPYRGRGLIRAQVAYFMERLRQRGCMLSHIQGIPFYYRQFGYEYAIPLEGGLRLSGHELPAAETDGYTFRCATPADIPLLVNLYDTAASDLEIHAGRSMAEWRFIFYHTPGTETEGETWLVEGNSEPPGYLRLPAHHFVEDTLVVGEVSRLSHSQALAVLNWVVAQAKERNTAGVRLNLPPTSTLMRAARAVDAHDLGAYAWQIHLPDVPALLAAIGPALEQRIAASPFAGLTRRVHLGFYRDSVLLDFVGGALTAVAASGPGRGDTNMPPQAFVKLVLGYKTIDELHAMYPDFGVAPAERWLLATLFPPVPAFLYSPY